MPRCPRLHRNPSGKVLQVLLLDELRHLVTFLFLALVNPSCVSCCGRHPRVYPVYLYSEPSRRSGRWRFSLPCLGRHLLWGLPSCTRWSQSDCTRILVPGFLDSKLHPTSGGLQPKQWPPSIATHITLQVSVAGVASRNTSSLPQDLECAQNS